MSKWKIIVNAKTNGLECFDSLDKVFYFEDYYSTKHQDTNEASNSIKNFKKHPSRRHNQQEWHYKEQAITEFHKVIESFPYFDENSENYLAFIPTSKSKADEEYDDRFVQVGNLLSQNPNKFKIVEPLLTKESYTASHHGGSRDISFLIQKWEKNPNYSSRPKILWILDDVITSGHHFKAYKTAIEQQFPETYVMGIAWTKTKYTSKELPTLDCGVF